MGGRRVRAALRWCTAPWREPLVLIALVVAGAAPVFLWVAGDVWLASAQDEIAGRIVEGAAAERLGIDIVVEGVLHESVIVPADAEVTRSIERIDGMGAVDRVLATFPDRVIVAADAPPVGPGVRLLARSGALDSVEVAAGGERTDGVWVSSWFADENGLDVGDHVAVQVPQGAVVEAATLENADAPFVHRVAGIYRAIWSDDPTAEPPPYWREVPPEYVPRYNSVLGGPTNELFIVDDEYLLDRGAFGVVRWRAPLDVVPSDYDSIIELNDQYRSLEARLVTEGDLSDAIEAVSGTAQRPDFRSDLFELTRSVERAAGRLAPPLRAARGGGVVVSLLTAAAAGLLLVERRRVDVRLLVGEGRRAPRLSLLVGAQLVAPFAVGAAAGAVGALIGVRALGPADRLEWGVVDVGEGLVVGGLALAVAAIAGGWWGSRVLEPVPTAVARAAMRVAAVALFGATIFVWVQVDRTAAAAGDLDLTVIALPVLLVASAVVIGLQLLGLSTALAAPAFDRLPVVPMLAARRLGTPSAGRRVVTGALGVGVGLLAFASVMTATLDRTVEVKLATEIGGQTRVDLIDPPPVDADIPGPSTVVGEFQTTLTPGRRRAVVLAVDPATFGDAVSWPAEFGIPYETAMSALTDDSLDDVPALALTGQSTRTTGSFGASTTYPYRVVARADGFPLAEADRLTLMVSRPALEDRIARAAGYASADEAAAAGQPVEIVGMAPVLLSQAPLGDVLEAVEALGLRVDEARSLAELRDAPEVVASRAAFSYLGVLGVVSAACSLLALVLFLAGRRQQRALAMVMTATMGLSGRRAAWITVIEVLVAALCGAAAGLLAAPVAVARLSERFDPAPSLPPDVSVVLPWAELLTGLIVAGAAIAAGLWWSERRSLRRAVTVVRGA